MNLAKINSEAIKELEVIIDDIFVARIDSILNEKLNDLSAEIVRNSRGITAKIRDVSTEVNTNKNDIEDLVDGIKSESENQNSELKKITSEGFGLIQNKLSDLQNVYLVEILSNAINILENQKDYSEDFLLKLEGAIKSHTENIFSNNSKNRELLEKSQVEFRSDIVALINGNGNIQKKNIQDLGESISNFVELENQNNSNLQKQLEFEFQKLKRLNSGLVRSFEEKTELLNSANEKQVLEVVSKSNKAFISVLVINFLILLFLVLKYFFNY